MMEASPEARAETGVKGLGDTDAYLATFPEDDQHDLAHADLVLDLVVLAQRVAEGQATWLTGLQAAFERLEQGGQLDVGTLEKYINELGYSFRQMSIQTAPPVQSTARGVG